MILSLHRLGGTGKFSGSAHVVWNESSGQAGKDMDDICSGIGGYQFPKLGGAGVAGDLSGYGKNEYDAAVFCKDKQK